MCKNVSTLTSLSFIKLGRTLIFKTSNNKSILEITKIPFLLLLLIRYMK